MTRIIPLLQFNFKLCYIHSSFISLFEIYWINIYILNWTLYVILKRLHQLYFFPFSFSSFSLHIFFFFRFDINIFIILVIAVCAIYSLHSVLIIEHYSLLTSPSSTSKLPSYPPTLTFTFFQLQFNSLRYSSF